MEENVTNFIWNSRTTCDIVDAKTRSYSDHFKLTTDSSVEFAMFIDYSVSVHARFGIVLKEIDRQKLVNLRIQFWIFDTHGGKVYEHIVESFIFTAEEQRCEFGSMPGTEREFMNNAYLERKNLVFGCKLTHLNPDPYLCVLSFKDSLVQKIKNAYKTGLHFDTTIEAEGKEFKVSRFILCAHSQIFRNMFSENYNENTNGKVKIDDITAQTMEAFLKWMHTGEILNENIVEELFVVADKYMVADLKSICSKIMVATLTETNAMQRLIIASKHNDNELEWKITGFIASKQPVFIHNIYQSKAWFEYLKLQHED